MREKQAPFLPATALPELTAVDLLEDLGYPVPNRRPLDWQDLTDFLLESDTGTFHEQNVTLFFPEGMQYRLAPQDLISFFNKIKTRRQRLPVQGNEVQRNYFSLVQTAIKKFFSLLYQTLKVWMKN
jgi:hypothetical protein